MKEREREKEENITERIGDQSLGWQSRENRLDSETPESINNNIKINF